MASPVHNSLHGKVVMVTGASAGLGRDFCLDLARAGCRIIALARRVDRLKSLCDQINQFSSSEALAVELDVTADGPTIDKSVQKAWDAFGRVDALINNAGFRGNVKSPLELSEEEWNQVFRTNLTGCWLVSKSVCTRMRDAQIKGSIINIASIAGSVRGQVPGATAYASSKAGVNMLTKVMALELGEYEIRVNSISPGLFKSEITEKLMEKDWLDTVAQKIVPLRRFGTADPALTSLARYLIHDSSEYVSGNNFIVDAGTTLPGNVKSPLELSEEERNQVFRTNLTGCWLVSKSVCTLMRDAQIKGSIINIASIAGSGRGQVPGATAYASSKAGVNMLTKVMALELGEYEIRVNSISPGLFKSKITEKLMEKDWLNKVA